LQRSGKSFFANRSDEVLMNDVSKMTDVYEGSLIRVFRRLEEALRQMAQAAKVMGNEELEKKFEESLTKVRRDIVAAQSLYL
jgi:ATP-dependent RNA helicase DOB1